MGDEYLGSREAYNILNPYTLVSFLSCIRKEKKKDKIENIISETRQTNKT